ncbi:MAG TPA: hypothetical protein VG826_26440 [Pirellulales bacterium]|nr:hypothetical protein [Pirellulales bacterium]
MQQVKIFKGIETGLGDLEDEINTWIVESQVEVLQIVGNIAPQTPSSKPSATGLTQGEFPPSDVIVVVLYKRPPK